VHPQDILADVRQFMKSRIILTAAELDLFTALAEGEAGAQEVASRKGLDEHATARLLDSLVTFGLLSKDRGRYGLTQAGACLSADNERSILPMLHHMNHLWSNWSHLTQTVIQGDNPEREPITALSPERREAFIRAMHVVGRDLAFEVAEVFGPTSKRRLLDIGGGSGIYSIAFLRHNPHLHSVLFDLPGVIPLAEEHIRAEGLEDRVELVPGDFYEDELPTGCDMALLSAIIHQNGPQENAQLYGKIKEALEPGGILLIRDHIMDETRTKPAAGALFAVNMVVNTAHGDTYTFSEVHKGLEEAGFEDIRPLRTGRDSFEKMDCLVEAKKPA